MGKLLHHHAPALGWLDGPPQHNLCTTDRYVEAANHSCGDFPPEVDEMALAGLTPMESELVGAYQLDFVERREKELAVLTAVDVIELVVAY